MAIKLREAGIDDFVILERADAVGGTWRDNTYPGCACDIQTHLYSFSFEPEPNWSQSYAPQPEIRQYIERCYDKYDIRKHVRFETNVSACNFDDATGRWLVDCERGPGYSATFLVSAIGGLSKPLIPELKGASDFEGAQFHSAQWDHDYDLRDKRVAVIGTGASAIQFIPEIQPQVAQLQVFQRTPPWVLPRVERHYTELEKTAFRLFPPARRAVRERLYWQHELYGLAFRERQQLLRSARRSGLWNIRRSIEDDELRRKLTPDYVPGCKRILMSNTYYPALNQPNVQVVTDPIERILPGAVRTQAGHEYPADAVVYGTGFDVRSTTRGPDVRGRAGRHLAEAWKDGPQAYLGVLVEGFPSMFTIMGPNSGLGHSSVIIMIEAQVKFIMECLELCEKRGMRQLEIRPEVQARFNAGVQQRLKRTVWGSGCASWYLDEQGNNRALWPGSTMEYRRATARVRPEDFLPAPPAYESRVSSDASQATSAGERAPQGRTGR